MSVFCSSRVWEHSQQSGSKLVVMLALADRADDDGFCWPSMDDIATRARLNSRQAQRVVTALEDAGELIVDRSAGRGRTSQYLVAVGMTADQIGSALVRRFGWSPADALAAAEKVTRVSPFSGSGKGDIQGEKVTHMSPFSGSGKGDIQGEKVTSRAEKVTSRARKGDIDVTRTINNHQSIASDDGSDHQNRYDRARRLLEGLAGLLSQPQSAALHGLIQKHTDEEIDQGIAVMRQRRDAGKSYGSKNSVGYLAQVLHGITVGDVYQDRGDGPGMPDRAGYAVNPPPAGQDDAPEESAPPLPAPADDGQAEAGALDPWAVVRAELRELVPVSHSRAIDLARFTNGDEYVIHISAGEGRDQSLVDYLGRYARQAKAAIVSLGRPALPVRFVLEESSQGVDHG